MADEFGDMRSRGGIWRERPRGKAGLRGVTGLSPRALSSFDFRFSGSRNLGDGDKVGGPPSERDRAFEGDRESVLLVPPSLPSLLSPGSSIGIGVSFN